MKGGNRHKKRNARKIRRFFHNIKINSGKVVAVVIAFTAVVVGAVPFAVSHVSGSYPADVNSSVLSLSSLSIAPVSVTAEIEENVSLLRAEEEESSKQAVEEEESRIAAEEEASRAAAEKEASLIAAEEEASRKAAEEEAASIAAEEESRKAAEEESSRMAAEEEASRKAAEEAASKAAETETSTKAAEEETKTESSLTTEALYSFSDFIWHGVVNWNGWRWTFYSETVLPGGGLNIPGRHVDENGYICDENNRICIASHQDDLPKGTIVATPFGKEGCVYDVCGVKGTLDVYVHWG